MRNLNYGLKHLFSSLGKFMACCTVPIPELTPDWQPQTSWDRLPSSTRRSGVNGSGGPILQVCLRCPYRHITSPFTSAKSPAVMASAAINFMHGRGLPSPSRAPMVLLALEGYKRATASPVIRKSPITPDTLQQVYMQRMGTPTRL